MKVILYSIDIYILYTVLRTLLMHCYETLDSFLKTSQ
jgi:hypothetical protein